ncbi:MAG: hypothetical protein ACREWG_07885 [Gammaproteobacteria bacterium]
MPRTFVSFSTAALLALCAATTVFAEDQAIITEPGFISGKMSIDFDTRKDLDTSGNFVEGSPAQNAADVYDLQLNVAKTTEYAGKIVRKPRLVSRVLGREEQQASLAYAVNLAVRNPKDLEQKKMVGKWAGNIYIDKNGVYDLSAGNLRMALDAVGRSPAFTGVFAGRIYGKGETKEGLVSQKISEYSRLIKGKKVSVKVKNSDPLKFSSLLLGEGPAQIYPKTMVDGNLDYDYETGNWYTNGVRFKYSLNGKEHEDVMTGSIKWVEDPNRASNGKGQYEFNLRFNEERTKGAADEGAAFAEANLDEEAFFSVDDSIPSMTGTVSYADTFAPSGDEEEPTVTHSEVVYNLDATKLTKQQAVNFFKLWLVVVGPTNDE